MITKSVRFLVVFLSVMLTALVSNGSAALSTFTSYTVTIEKINSDGTVSSGATSLGLSTTGTTDGNGKLSFTLSSVPSNDTCNFMVLTLTDSNNTTVRRGIAPCPDASSTMPLGVSELTATQTTGLLAAFAAAGSDDPILAVFGNIVLRSTLISNAELSSIASICSQGISSSGGFVDYLTTQGVTTTELALYRKAIIASLANTSSGYSKLMKEAVDDGIATSAAAERQKRGEAAALLLKVLVDAADTAGFEPDLILQCFDAMGSVVMPLFSTAVANSAISANTMATINSTIGGGIDKLRAEKEITNYQNALTALGATGADVTQFSNAAATMSTAMIAAFHTFEEVFDGSEDQTTVGNAQTALDAAMNTAFNNFMTSVAASGARVTTLVSAINGVLGAGSVSNSDFTTYNSSGTPVNWPIMMVVATSWVNDSVATSGTGAISYTRDTTSVPSGFWVGTCSNTTYTDPTTCGNNGATWTAARTNFVGQGIPAAYATLFGVQEDIMIQEYIRYDAGTSAGNDMSAQQVLEKAYSDALDSIAGNITGTNPAGTALTTAQKKALVLLMKSPQF